MKTRKWFYVIGLLALAALVLAACSPERIVETVIVEASNPIKEVCSFKIIASKLSTPTTIHEQRLPKRVNSDSGASGRKNTA